VIGSFKTVVKLSDNSFGLSSTVLNSHEIHCKKEQRDYSEFTPGKIKGAVVMDLLLSEKQSGIVNTLKVAVINAISWKLLKSPNYKMLRNTDPIDLVDLKPGLKLVLVGAFHSYIKKAKEHGCEIRVLELDENALHDEDTSLFVRADRYPEIIPTADILIITGLTIVNKTLDNLLDYVMPHTQVIVSGLSSSFIPDALFAKRVNYIGSIGIEKPQVLWQIVSEGGAGYHTLHYCCEKNCMVKKED